MTHYLMLSFFINSSLSIFSASSLALAYWAYISAICCDARFACIILLCLKIMYAIREKLRVIGTPNLPNSPLSSSSRCLRIRTSFPYIRYSSYTISFFDQPFLARVFTIFFISWATLLSESWIARSFSAEDASLTASKTSLIITSWFC